MKNSTEYLKGCKVPTISDGISLDRLEHEGKKRKDHRTAWGNNDFKSLIRQNMEGYKERRNE